MKKIHYIFCAILMTATLLTLSQKVYAKGGGYHKPHKVCDDIQADKAKVAGDRTIIRADKQALKEAKRSRNKVKVDQAQDKLKRDIQQYKKDKVALEKCED